MFYEKVHIVLTIIATSIFFGSWVKNIRAGFFMFGLLSFIILFVEYLKGGVR